MNLQKEIALYEEIARLKGEVSMWRNRAKSFGQWVSRIKQEVNEW